ncbi:hypothetical protein HYW54_04825 [Candidatus Gottesmanbacteria bacterium]|nr:hypothetical protein [Candidatus Gottesmanbacteria bacterium]
MSEAEFQGLSQEEIEKIKFDPDRAIYLGKILYDPESRICLVNNQQIRLTQSEAAMLQAVGIHAGKFARQDSILRAYQDLLGDQTEQVAYDSGPRPIPRPPKPAGK